MSKIQVKELTYTTLYYLDRKECRILIGGALHYIDTGENIDPEVLKPEQIEYINQQMQDSLSRERLLVNLSARLQNAYPGTFEYRFVSAGLG